MKIIITDSALKDLKQIDTPYQKLILSTLEDLEKLNLKNFMPKIVKLSGNKQDLYRLRIRDYRAILDIKTIEDAVEVLRIRHRKSVYNDISR